MVEQHGIPGPPQVPQVPLEQVPVNGLQELPLLTHWPLTQQPLPVQVLPAQHALPAAPHVLLLVPAVLPPVTSMPPLPLLAIVPAVTAVLPAELVAVPPAPAALPELPAAED